MVIKRLKGAKFGTDRIARVVTGYALYAMRRARATKLLAQIEMSLVS